MKKLGNKIKHKPILDMSNSDPVDLYHNKYSTRHTDSHNDHQPDIDYKDMNHHTSNTSERFNQSNKYFKKYHRHTFLVDTYDVDLDDDNF